MREIVLYIPTGGHPAMAGIVNMRSLADRAIHAAERMVERYATTATRVVPRDALIVVGTFDFRRGRIMLTGSNSERVVAEWLGLSRLDPAELRPSEGSGR